MVVDMEQLKFYKKCKEIIKREEYLFARWKNHIVTLQLKKKESDDNYYGVFATARNMYFIIQDGEQMLIKIYKSYRELMEDL